MLKKIGVWKMFFNFLDLLMNNFLVLVLTVLGVILAWIAVSNLLQKKYGPGGIFAFLSGLALILSTWFASNNKDKYKQEIKEIDKQIDEKKKELEEVNKQVEENKEKQKELEKKEEVIEQTLQDKLEEADQVKPVEVKTDEEISNAFDFASKYSKS